MPYKNKDKQKEASREWESSKKGKTHRQQIVYRFWQNRVQLIKSLKINGCAICGYDNCSRCLDFHHVNPEDKKFNLNTQTAHNHSLSKVFNELHKCILLCKNCHGELHDKVGG